MGEIDVPCGPQSEMSLESEQISQIFYSLNQIEKMRQQISLTEEQIWQINDRNSVDK